MCSPRRRYSPSSSVVGRVNSMTVSCQVPQPSLVVGSPIGPDSQLLLLDCAGSETDRVGSIELTP